MRQRFGIAQALLGAPRLVIVDEPTAGLDPDERNRFLNLLAKIGEQVVVILSTHIVEDVTDLCPRMAMIHVIHGRLLHAGLHGHRGQCDRPRRPVGLRADRPVHADDAVRLSVRPVHRGLPRDGAVLRQRAVGMLAGTIAPWVDHETIGPFRPGDYLYAYFVLGPAGVFLTSALFFALATVTKSMMATYVGVVAVLIAYLVAIGVLGSKPEFEHIMAWAEPLGSSAYGLVTKYWTPAEKNTLNVPLEGVFLWNRLIWTWPSVSASWPATYWLYQPTGAGAEGRQDREAAQDGPAEAPARAASTGPLASAAATAGPAPGPSSRPHAPSTWAGVQERRLRDPDGPGPGFAMVAAGSGEIYGTPVGVIYPVTRVMITALQGSFGLVAMIVAIYYSGELVWRDRDRKTHELIDARRRRTGPSSVPKTLALILVLASILLVGVIAGDHHPDLPRPTFDFEIGKYLLWYVLPRDHGSSP
jgi:ABC-2 type transport system permease protein